MAYSASKLQYRGEKTNTHAKQNVGEMTAHSQMFQAEEQKRYVEVIWTNNVIKEERQCMYTVTLRGVRVKDCCRGKAKSIIYSECGFEDLGIQHAMRHTVFCGLSGSTVFLPHYLTNKIVKKFSENKMCFDFLYNSSLKCFSR